jgi:hypothetical protein
MAGHGIYGPDFIGKFTAAGTTVSLQQSRVTVGGLQYDISSISIPVTGVASNSIYNVYLVDVADSPTLVADRRPNSLGPDGYTAWKLVGAFMSNNTGDGVGSALNTIGEPNSGHIPINNWGCNWDSVLTSKTGTYKFMGDRIELNYRALFTGPPPLVNLTISMPSGFTMTLGEFETSNKQFGILRITDVSTGIFPAFGRYTAPGNQLFFGRWVQGGGGAAFDPIAESTLNGNNFPSLNLNDIIEFQGILPLGDDDNNIQLIDR